MKKSSYLIFLMLAFVAGSYLLNGWLITDMAISQKGLPEIENATTLRLDKHQGRQLLQISAEKTASAETADQIIHLIWAGQMDQALVLFENGSLAFSSSQLDEYGRALVSFLAEGDPGDFYRQETFQNLVSVLTDRDPYSPAAQYFDVIRLAVDEPLLALARLDELASYYQEQIAQEQIVSLELWLMGTVEHSLAEKENWQQLEDWYQALAARSTEPIEIYARMARIFDSVGRTVESERAVEYIERLR